MKINGLFAVILASLLPLFTLLHPGLPVTHDGADHLARIANFYNGLTDGIWFPRWGENLNWGYGHPVLMFLYPFSSYAASLFHFLGFSYIDSLKLVFAFGYIASGITMYIWAKEQFDDDVVGVVAAFLYLFAPYRFVDLYVRGAIGEHMAFVFPPLVLFFIIRFFKSKKFRESYFNLYGIGFSFALLLLSHNAISLIFVPVFFSYTLLIAYQYRKLKHVTLVFIFFLIGLLLSAFFTFPAFFEGKYTLRDIVTGEEYKSRFVDNPLKFVYGEWNYGITGQFSVQLGIVHLLSLVFLPFLFMSKRIKRGIKYLVALMLVFLVFSLFIQLSISNFLYEIVTTFKKFQFPWRFLSLSTFMISVVSASVLLLLEKQKKNLAVFVILVILIFSTFPFWRAKAYFEEPDSFYDKIYHGTTDTGESAPIWSVRFMEKEPVAPIEVIYGQAKISEIERRSNIHSYKIDVTSDTARIRENTLYFPGWRVFVDGKQTEIQFQDPQERGLITFVLPEGEHFVDVKFGDTRLRTISNMLSLASLGFLVISFGIVKFKKFNYEK